MSSNAILESLKNQRLNAWESAKELADHVASENRDFSGEEQASWDKMNASIDAFDKRMKTVIDQDQRSADMDAAMAKAGRSTQTRIANGGGTDKAAELRSFLTGQGGAKTLDIVPAGIVDYRSLSKLTAGAGGNTVPTDFYRRLVAHLIETGALIGAGVTVLNTAGGEQIQVPKTTAHSTAALVAEAGTIGASDPVFGQVPLDAYKYSFLTKVSRELLADTGVDLEGYLAMQAGRALGNAVGAALVVGTGSSQPQGIVPASSLGVTGATGDSGGFGTQSTAAKGADQLMDLFYSVIAPYRASNSCGWLMRDATAGIIRKLKDSTGQYVWQPTLSAGAPDLLLSKPVTYDPNVAAVGLNAKSVIFGDFSQYFVRIAGGVRFERSDDFAFDTDLVTFRAIMRADGDLVDTTGAVKYFVGGAS